MDPRTSSALTLGWQLVAAILARLAVLAERAWLPGPVWFRVFAELRRAEAATRRLLVVLAGDMAVNAGAPVLANGGAVAKALQSPAGPPGFALFDSLSEPGFGMRQDIPEQPADGNAFHATDGLAARLAALSALAVNPAPAVRRMALWLARTRSPRTSPLRPGLPPGAGQHTLLDREQDVLMQCDGAAREVLNRPLPP
jgi:hypothetical protein